MRERVSTLWLAALATAAGCGSSDEAGSDSGGQLTGYRECTAETRVGEFDLQLIEDPMKAYTGVTGGVLDGVEPGRIATQVMQMGACRLLKPPLQRCTPECDQAKQVCTKNGCAPKPELRNVGKVTLSGLKVPVTLENLGNLYANPKLPHPGFDEGANISLTAAGGDAGYGPFSLKGYGVALMKAPSTPLLVEDKKAVTLTWTPPTKQGPVRVVLTFGINWHGGADTWLECDVEDKGSFTIAAPLITELFKHGVSGYPRVTLRRQSADSTPVKSGCVQFWVSSELERNLTVPGLESCMDDDGCPAGKKCRSETLSCSP